MKRVYPKWFNDMPEKFVMYVNLYTSEYTMDYSVAQNWWEHGMRVRAITIRNKQIWHQWDFI